MELFTIKASGSIMEALLESLDKQIVALEALQDVVERHLAWRITLFEQLRALATDADSEALQAEARKCRDYFFFGESAIDLVDSKGQPAR